MRRHSLRCVFAVLLVSVLGAPLRAASPGPTNISSLFVPLEGDVAEPGTNNFIHLTGEVHIIMQTRFDAETNQWAVTMFVNLVRVRGTSATTGIVYLGVGAGNVSWVSLSPGPPDDPQMDFALVSLALPPNPFQPPNPLLPVVFRNFVFAQERGAEGTLLSVTASFD